jgi:membrane-bound metal-dependent hydrolase YbcI (DUF457 family)
MFIGHLAVALGARKVEPRLPLATLTMAAFGLDVLWPIFLLTGLEVVRVDPGNTAFTPLDFVSYPWSHSLLMSVVWGTIAALAAARWFRSQRIALVIGLAIVSHWILDWITHRPDLPLWPGGPRVGLGLWNSIPATILVESALLASGIALYLRVSRARDAIGRWAFRALILVAVAIWISGPFTAPPPSVEAIGWVSLAGVVMFLAWTIWIERHREPR